jgi:hypothetical protein
MIENFNSGLHYFHEFRVSEATCQAGKLDMANGRYKWSKLRDNSPPFTLSAFIPMATCAITGANESMMPIDLHNLCDIDDCVLPAKQSVKMTRRNPKASCAS